MLSNNTQDKNNLQPQSTNISVAEVQLQNVIKSLDLLTSINALHSEVITKLNVLNASLLTSSTEIKCENTDFYSKVQTKLNSLYSSQTSMVTDLSSQFKSFENELAKSIQHNDTNLNKKIQDLSNGVDKIKEIYSAFVEYSEGTVKNNSDKITTLQTDIAKLLAAIESNNKLLISINTSSTTVTNKIGDVEKIYTTAINLTKNIEMVNTLVESINTKINNYEAKISKLLSIVYGFKTGLIVAIVAIIILFSVGIYWYQDFKTAMDATKLILEELVPKIK